MTIIIFIKILIINVSILLIVFVNNYVMRLVIKNLGTKSVQDFIIYGTISITKI